MSETLSQSGTGAVRKIAFVSLGCPKNLVDSEAMLGSLAGEGFELVSDHDEADAVIVNTCGFIEASKEESLEVINEAIERKEKGDLKRVIVAGCLVQRHRAKLLDWAPGIDAMIGVFDRDHIADAVLGPGPRKVGETREGSGPQAPYWIAANALVAARDRNLKTVGLTVKGDDGKGLGYYEDDSKRFRLTPRHWAYLRMSEGCNQNCAFCTIPSIRGKMRSKPPEVLVREARELLAEGCFELSLIGEDTTSYGRDIGYDGEGEGLAGVLRSLNDAGANSGGAWLRLMYAYPTRFTDEIIDAIAELDNVVKYVDMPLQHMSDRMLSAMKRNVTRKQQEELLYKLRERIPGLAIRTTFITGFPGETQEDHAGLLEFIEEFQFDMMGVFKFSSEDNTPAAAMDEDEGMHVPNEVKVEREAELMLAQQEIAFENAAYLAEQGAEFDVLIDAPGSEDKGASCAGEDAGGVRRAGTVSDGAGASSGGAWVISGGRCYHQAPEIDSVTYVQARERLSPGELVRCTIVDADGYDLIARPSAELEKRTSLTILH